MTGTTIQVLGWDPGKHGALVWINSHGDPFRVWRMFLSAEAIDWGALRRLLQALRGTATFEVAIEKQQGFGRIKGVSTVMENYGRAKLCIEMAGLPYTEYPQATWKSAYGLWNVAGRRQGKTFAERNRENKAASLKLADVYWPRAASTFGAAWTPDAAEAALIGQLHRGKIIERERGGTSA